MYIITLAPLSVVAVGVFIFVALMPQTKEILVHVLASGTPDPTYYLVPLLALALFCALLLFGSAQVCANATRRVSPDALTVDRLRRLFLKSVVITCLLLVSIGIVLVLVSRSTYDVLSPAVKPSLVLPTGARVELLFIALALVILFGLALLSLWLVHRRVTDVATCWLIAGGYIGTQIVLLLVVAVVSFTSWLALPVSWQITTRFGPIGLCILFAALLLLVCRGLAGILSTAKGAWFAFVMVACIALVHIYDLNDVFFVRFPDAKSDKQFDSVPCKGKGQACATSDEPDIEPYKIWLRAREHAIREYRGRAEGEQFPIYLFLAQGGGLYSAFHAASTIAALLDVCPRLRQHIFAISGVSGGAIGAAVLTALMRAHSPVEQQACNVNGTPVGDDQLLPRVRAVLERDLLSPILSAGLFVDVPRSLLPARYVDFIGRAAGLRHFGHVDRAIAFEDAIIQRVNELGSTPHFQVSEAVRFLRSDIRKGLIENPAAHQVIFGSTIVEQGRIAIFGPDGLYQSDDPAVFLGTTGIPIEMSVIGAASLSARFPFISPPGAFTLRRPGREDATFHLTDGGFLDNSASLQIASVLQNLRYAIGQLKLDARVEVISVSSVLRIDSETMFEGPGFNEFTTVYHVVDNVRRVGAWERLRSLHNEEEKKGSLGCRSFLLPSRKGATLPLTWFLSDGSHSFILKQIGLEFSKDGAKWMLQTAAPPPPPVDGTGASVKQYGCDIGNDVGDGAEASNKELNWKILTSAR